jgi:hypothetical protein
MDDFIILQVGMTLKQIVLHLNVPFDIADISFSITLSLLIVFSNLFFEPVLYPFLQSLKFFLAFFFHSQELFLQIMRALSFSN